MLAAFWYTNRVGTLIGAGIVVFVIAYASKALEEDFLVEVFDDGDRMRFELDEERVSVDLAEIEKAVFQDGGDGKDTVTILTCHANPFGRQVEFIPEPNHRFQGDPKRWFDDLEKRIFEAKTKVSENVTKAPVGPSCESISASGQNWM
jgi:hypothetical protein